MRPIEEYHRDYGDTANGFAKLGDGDDWLPAFRRAMDEHRNPNLADGEMRFRAYRTTTLLGPRTYRLSGPLEFDRALTICGEGSRSELFFQCR